MGWGTVVAVMDTPGGFPVCVETVILGRAAGSVPWNNPRVFGVRVERGMFCFLGRGVPEALLVR